MKKCKQDDYQRALNVFTIIKCNTINEYLSIYLKCDVLILADIIKCFKKCE